MNTLEHVVTQVLSPPTLKYGYWYVRVLADSWGHVSESECMFKTEAAAKTCAVGYRFDA